ncbi:uncharacterized protein LOC115632878 isoform X3 [Scaptodrosophila lebanonensis]|uniref:Uncharacterized protein LOC115632878 isoform X3 n=1 Tax=Drosophila lebanonensis TaxID=7225 RepID=A0A6J2UC07_DROLE|nr:uncharacterized protein LOC115632878 isoform X3 [Scaptodrosophila lebanonensis]
MLVHSVRNHKIAMGVTDAFETVKQWTMSAFGRHPPAKQISEPTVPNLGEDIRLMVQTREFGKTLDAVSPYLLASLGVWPGYWLYRGLDYHSHRAHIPLPMYIRQTFFQAKLLQLAIILTGIFSIVRDHHKTRLVRLREKQGIIEEE